MEWAWGMFSVDEQVNRATTQIIQSVIHSFTHPLTHFIHSFRQRTFSIIDITLLLLVPTTITERHKGYIGDLSYQRQWIAHLCLHSCTGKRTDASSRVIGYNQRPSTRYALI